MDRFFCPTLTADTTVTLDGDEFHHLAHVLRGKPGDRVELFDGQGHSAEAILDRVTKRDAHLTLAGEVRQQPPAGLSLVLAVACPKGDRLKWLVEKATELGAAELVPVITERAVVEPRETKLAKLEQTVLSACKQCRRDWLMSIREPQALNDFLKGWNGPAWMAHPGGQPAGELLNSLVADQSGHKELAVAIGPEGGFSPAEVELARAAGVSLVSLGPHVLRVETAAIAAAAIVMASAGDGR